MIHEIWLSAANEDDAAIFTEPSERYLKVEVIAGEATLGIYRYVAEKGLLATEAEASISVSAASLIRALTVISEDEIGGLPQAWATSAEAMRAFNEGRRAAAADQGRDAEPASAGRCRGCST